MQSSFLCVGEMDAVAMRLAVNRGGAVEQQLQRFKSNETLGANSEAWKLALLDEATNRRGGERCVWVKRFDPIRSAFDGAKVIDAGLFTEVARRNWHSCMFDKLIQRFKCEKVLLANPIVRQIAFEDEAANRGLCEC